MFFVRKRYEQILALKALCTSGDAVGIFSWTFICYAGKQEK